MSIQKKVIISTAGVLLLAGAVASFIVSEPQLTKSAATSLLSVLNSAPASVYALGVTSFVGAISVSPVALAIKKWFSIDSERKMIVIVSLASFVSAVVGYLVTTPKFGPWIIALESAVTLGMSQPIYFLFIKPVSTQLIAAVLGKVASMAQEIEARAAQVPQGGIPAVPTYTDFK